MRALAVGAAFVAGISANAAIVNGGFELGTPDSWTTLGDVSVTGASFGVTPPEGSFQAVLTTIGVNDIDASFQTIDPYSGTQAVSVASLEAFLGAPGLLNTLGNGDLGLSEGSLMSQVFHVSAGDILSFEWNFLTDEFAPEINYNDFAFLVIGSSVVELADLNADFAASLSPFAQETGWRHFEYVFDADGPVFLALGVSDAGDDLVVSALLVDNFVLRSAIVPEPAAVTLLALGLAGAAFRRAGRRR